MRKFLDLPCEARYLLIGIWNTIVGYSLFTLFVFLFPPYQYILALTLSTALAGANSYLTQRLFVWRSSQKMKQEIIRFSVIFIGQFFVNVALLYVLVEQFGFHPLWTQYLLGAVIIISTYYLNKNWTFRLENKS
jgi:putative flippase GtrA